MIAVGIDIGLTGAVAFVDSRGTCVLADMPLIPVGEKQRVHGRALLDLMRAHVPAGETAIVVFEDVQARPMGNGSRQGNTMHSQGSMMRTRGAIESAIDILGQEVRVVQPQTWKRFYGLIKADRDEKPTITKARSMDCARRLYPQAPLSLVKHHNRAEALLIAHYALKKFA